MGGGGGGGLNREALIFMKFFMGRTIFFLDFFRGKCNFKQSSGVRRKG